jgi:hypothetical protein
MTRPLPFTQTGLCRALTAARKAGFRVTGIRADGTLMISDGDNQQHEVAGGAPGSQALPASKWEDIEA